MVEAYNFLGSWQLFPEKGTYEFGDRPKSGIYKIEKVQGEHALRVSQNWVTLEDYAYSATYSFVPDGAVHPFENPEVAEQITGELPDSRSLVVEFLKADATSLKVAHELLPSGFLQLTQTGVNPAGLAYTNTEIYHRQLSVLPYSASVSGAVIKPTEEGVIRHKALTAMEEQTNMQLGQIRQQIELLALQAQEIQKRKELSMLIYNAQLRFQPVIGQIYHLYEREDNTHMISMVGPAEWGSKKPYRLFLAKVQLLADHTWKEVL